MLSSLIASAILLFHLAFIAFVVLGGFAALRWRRVAWIHVPAAIWGVLVELAGWYCPLTEWENRFRLAAGKSEYGDSFINHYVSALIYPPGLTRQLEIALGIFAALTSVIAYALFLRKALRR